MDRLLVPIAAIAIVLTISRAASAYCRNVPSHRPRLIVASLGLLGVAALLVPWVLAKLEPPVSESPAGVFVYLGKAAIVGSLGLAGLGTLIGALVAGRRED